MSWRLWSVGGYGEEALLREKELLEEIILVVGDVHLRDQVSDRWVWHNDRSGSFSVKDAYKVIVSNRRDLGSVLTVVGGVDSGGSLGICGDLNL
ncbi:hypothetical protein L195_g046420 [Trifolium pratense]|uniref:Uncharacterized protein n=1 Tax=Trifolium pratense TaxID=57577 RepID=A0A2K3MHN3_TRIPR|nr:hypothetical protein L195_g046420 [Trifolium pratense]